MLREQQNARHQAALMELARLGDTDWDAALQRITEIAAGVLEAHRVGVWLFCDDSSAIVCEDLYDARGSRHEKGDRLEAAAFPRYFQSLHENRTVMAEDARSDPRTSELAETYLVPLGIASLLDVPIWHDGKIAGVLCHEHAGAPRHWNAEEQELAASVAASITRAWEAAGRLRAVEALRESEERFKSAFERSSIGMAIVGVDDRFLQVNAALCALFGYSPQEMRALSTAQVTHPEDLQELRRTGDNMARLLSGQIPSFQVEKRYRRKDGDFFWGLVGVSLVRDADGSLLHFISQVQDITERKHAEEERALALREREAAFEALRRAHDELEARVAERTAELTRANAALQSSEEHFRTLTENASDIITILDVDAVIGYQSPAAERLFGYRIEEMVGRSGFDFFHPDDVPASAAALEHVLRYPGTSRMVEFRFRHKDGHYLCCEAVGRTRRPDSAADGIVVNTRDITARKEAEACLQETEERTCLIIDNALDAVMTMSADGRITSWNAQAETVFGWARAEALGRRISETIIPQSYRAAHEQGLQHFWETGEGPVLGQRVEITALRRDGSEFPVELAVTAVGSGDNISFSAFVRDITARKRTEKDLQTAKEAAEAADRAKSEFLSRMSHELRTPMNSILGFAQLLERKPLPPDQRRSVDHILKAGRHLLNLINEVLDIARIEANRLQLSLEPVHVGGIVEEALTLIQPLAAQHGCYIDRAGAADSGLYVLADRQRLTQVLLNLLSNAVKYNRPGGSVRLSCERIVDAAGGGETRERLLLQVQDTGPGMSPEELARLFVPFERLGAEQSGIEGTGLGLALSKRLVEAMGGTVTVESAVGRGSAFCVALDLAQNPLERLEQSGFLASDEAAALPQKRATVLYIEDNLANLSLIETILSERAGITLLSALQGRLGLDLAWEHHPDLILLDLHLPDMAGDEVLRRLQSEPHTRDIPVAIISADATPGRVERLMQAGARAYLTKPLDIEQFLVTVDEILTEK